MCENENEHCIININENLPEDIDCCICLENNYDIKLDYVTCCCNTKIHKNCLIIWILYKKLFNCPNCRSYKCIIPIDDLINLKQKYINNKIFELNLNTNIDTNIDTDIVMENLIENQSESTLLIINQLINILQNNEDPLNENTIQHEQHEQQENKTCIYITGICIGCAGFLYIFFNN